MPVSPFWWDGHLLIDRRLETIENILTVAPLELDTVVLYPIPNYVCDYFV